MLCPLLEAASDLPQRGRFLVPGGILRELGPEKKSMPNGELPISFGAFLIKGILPKLTERSVSGRPFIRLGRTLALSCWLYETGAILGRLWIDRIPVVVSMYEVEDKREGFAQYWRDQAKNRLESYRRQPQSFPLFVLETDLNMLMTRRLDDLPMIADKKLLGDEGNRWLRLAELSLVEGIMFGSLYPDLTHGMLSAEWEEVDTHSWQQARKHGVILSEEPPHMTVADKEEEVIEMARDYVTEYHPELTEDLGLARI